MISVMIMANVLVKKHTVLKNVMNVSMDILVSPIAKVLYPKLFFNFTHMYSKSESSV